MRRAEWGLVAIVALAAALRLATLGVQSYWFDEAVTVHLLRDSLGGMLGAIPDSESTPPLYYVVAWFWTKLFGTGEVGVRSLSALFGIATVPLAYAIGLRWTRSTRVALIAALLVACNPLLIWYSQEARAYSLLVLLTAATLLVLPDALEQGRGRALTRWAVLAALALATHYFALFIVAPEAVWLLRRHGRAVVPALAGVAGVGVLLLPLAVSQAANDGARFIREVALGGRMIAIPKQLLVGYDAPGEVIAAALAGLLVGVLAWVVIVRLSDAERRTVGQLAAIGLAVVLIPLVLSLTGLDYLITRNLIAASVPVLVAIAVAAGGERAGLAGIATGVGLCAIGVAIYVGVEANGRYQRDDWKGIAEAIGEPHGSRAILVSPANGYSPMELYLPDARRIARDVPKLDEIWVVAVAKRQPGEDTRPPDPVVAESLPGGFELAGTQKTDTFSITHYRTPDGVAVLVDPDILRTLAFNPVPISTLVEAVDP